MVEAGTCADFPILDFRLTRVSNYDFASDSGVARGTALLLNGP